MSTTSETVLIDVAEAWAADNQRHLRLVAESVAAYLDGHPDQATAPAQDAGQLARRLLDTTGAPTALDRLTALFGLTGFERDLLVAAAAPGLGLPCATGPVVLARALATIPAAHWSAVLPDGPLRGWRLLDPLPGPAGESGLLQLPLTVDERVAHALVGADTVDARLAGRAQLARGVCRLPASYRCVTVDLASVTGTAILIGDDRLTRRQLVLNRATESRLSVLVVDGSVIPDDAAMADTLSRLLAREAGLGRRLILVESDDAVDRVQRLAAATASWGVPTIVSADDRPPSDGTPTIRLPALTFADRRELFLAAMSEWGASGDTDELAHAHLLTPAAIALAVERAARASRPAGHAEVDAACRAATDRPLHGLAVIRRPVARLSDLVLAESAERAIESLLAHVRQRRRVHGEWGYAARGRGLAVTALLTGPSGTGKTTAAEAVAAELGLDLVVVDLSQVVSKYIGETEKHLAELFDAAEAGSVLLFDEGDALFGRRTQVRDAHDRYANLETSYLLQRLDTYAGIAILTTNNRDGIDPAFTRRMRFVINFPFPDAEQRRLLWQRAFPAGVPTEGLDAGRLAQLAVSGGTIAALALHAAFLAADADQPVGMAHLLAAARIESEKLERPLAAQETRGWL